MTSVRSSPMFGSRTERMDHAPRKIIHIDMDAFYASVEQRDDPSLRDRPIAVGGASERGVVAAASYEARAYGVRSAMPSVTARRKCPELIFVKPRFDHYRAISRDIRAILADYTPLVEPLSLDEAYLDITVNLKAIPTATETAQEIRARITAETGLTASAGVSYCKFLAKIASDYRKPNGQFVITPETGPAFVADLPVGRIHGIGPATERKLHGMGIRTGANLRARSLEELVGRFGKAGHHYYAVARGIDTRPVKPDRIRKSVGAEETFNADLHDFAALAGELETLLDRLVTRIERASVAGARTLTLKVKYADFTQITRSRTRSALLSSREDMRAAALDLLESVFPLDNGVRLLGVSLSGLVMEEKAAGENAQLALAL